MSENIAGYIDRSYIKGQTYRYAATPAPIVFTGNIDEISDNDLLSKAMLVTRGQVGGKLPNEFGNTFLITTVKYGNNTYLQTAYLVQSGYECWEYRRIYSSGWTEWIGVDSAINLVNSKIDGADQKADSALAAISGTNGINSQISDINTKINTINNTTIPSLSGDIDQVRGRVGTLETNSSTKDISNTYTVTKTGGSWGYSSLIAKRTGNVVAMSIIFSIGKNVEVKNGSDGFIGKIDNGPLPAVYTRLTSFYGKAIIMASFGTDGSIRVRVTGDTIKPTKADQAGVAGMFVVGSSSNQESLIPFVEEFPVVPYN